MPASFFFFSRKEKPPRSDGAPGPGKERRREKKNSAGVITLYNRFGVGVGRSDLGQNKRTRTSQSRVQLQEDGQGSDARPVVTAARWKQTRPGSQWSAAPSITAGPLTSPPPKKKKRGGGEQTGGKKIPKKKNEMIRRPPLPHTSRGKAGVLFALWATC